MVIMECTLFSLPRLLRFFFDMYACMSQARFHLFLQTSYHGSCIMATLAHCLSKRERKMTTELTFLSRQWEEDREPPIWSLFMASSEVDQKFLGHFAKTTSQGNPILSSMLYKVLGLSVILSEKLLRARKQRRLDPTRDTKSVQLYHHILWLAREGLVITEQWVLQMVNSYVELKVLSYKLRASFYHIFVLFHNRPSVNKAAGPFQLIPDPLSPRGSIRGKQPNRDSILKSPPPVRSTKPSYTLGGPVGPPGLPPPNVAPASASFLLPAIDYIPTASNCFAAANELAETLLPGSHPVRLSVKVEYVAYLYDCLHDGENSRRLAKKSIRDVYTAQEGMDDDSFEDAAELVGVLGKMMRRGLRSNEGSGTGGSGTGSGGRSQGRGSNSTPRNASERRKTPPKSAMGVPKGTDGLPMAMPSPGMANPI